MSDQLPEQPPESHKDMELKPSGHAAWRWPVVIVLIAAFGLGTFVYVISTLIRTPERLIETAGKGVAGVANALDDAAAKFRQGTITETFTASLPKLESQRGGLLELSKVTATETFRSKDELTYDFRWFEVDVGTTITEIRVPVTYRYHLRMRDAWQLSVTNNVCIVHAPEIRPSQPPAIHTDRMEKSSDEGWARFNAEEQMTQLEKTITPTIRKYASDEQHLDVIRENCRKTVSEFIEDWLLREGQWGEDRLRVVKVYFSGEGMPTPAVVQDDSEGQSRN
ncbi:MAG: hypothetical protein QF749_07480 [Verrucomicrobiota bacterium]|jgi:hypothetical protein|nr:hypothetical protein [Verrucomicrobiota bacterium]MDP6251052.1 hypothetical protein [Verrucomicrobiota bacterium]MDP7178122.1 hypothetical protein [Verrucomicrobiota bacterium]MDP7291792.1 hypothetical protein [Verrucomicrobiota bacterium]MDP7442005.1 hypothetical protein [Verrucomicrobiota bacterium]|tara:strand:- start:236 stop:1075 length:840 start_codon:yes stop_codon:yes gene_type:complete